MPSNPAPERFGRFILLDEAGAGAMGTVYAAYDPGLDRRVALKVLHNARAAYQDRIRREAVAMARVSHPNVVQVYEVGEQDGRLFIAMEFVDGPTLSEWQLDVDDWAELVRVYVEVGQGLAAAHQAGLVHRDFKPDNVLVGADGRPRVIDFGLARAPHGEGLEPANEGLQPMAETPETFDDLEDSADLLSSPLTRTGHVLGTPAYMPPEQMDGQPPTAASDQFAFAVALYEALYDQPPFPRDSLPGLRRAVSKGLVEPPPPGRVIQPVHAALVRALAPEPGARWPEMSPMLATLSRYAASDDLRDRRSRLVLAIILVALVLSAMALMRTIAPPRTATDLLIGESAILLAMTIGVTVFWRLKARTTLHHLMAAWVLLVGASKVAGALMGVAFELPPETVQAFDTTTLALMSAVATFMVRRALWPMLVVSALAVIGVAVWPSASLLMHDLSLLSIGLTMIGYTSWHGLRDIPRSADVSRR